ncbi:MAG: XTP/dITP diphosphatase [Desulfohalobiaceae bacterium]
MNETIVLATRNKGKIAEIEAVLGLLQPGLTVLGLEDFPAIGDIPEHGTTFEANAVEKARVVTQHTGLVSLADDSGLEVDALDGAPGVYSARFSGPGATDEANNQKLLRKLAGLPPVQRSARFRCVLAALAPGGELLLARGAWEGRIAKEPRGEGGFGYDPLFVDPELEVTAAQMSPEQKNARSHRGKALRSLAQQWPEYCKKLRSGHHPRAM